MFRKLWQDESGIVAIEYLFLATIVGLGLVVGFGNLEGALNAEFSELSRQLGLPPRMIASASGRVTRYTDAAGRPKVARYWLMTPAATGHEWHPNREIDDLRWCTRDEAARLLSYLPDRQLLAELPEDAL